MSSKMEDARRALRDVFGHQKFRLLQEKVIERLLVENDNALVLFPTGGGKSLTFQVPALCLDALTLVISPLISLMKDQVDVLVNLGVKAASLDSTVDAEKSAFIRQEILSGQLKILYVAPERLNNENFVEMINHVPIGLLAVDESHCISQWGTSFRPDYLKIARFATEHPNVQRVLCLTATAIPNVAEDICREFLIKPEGVFRTPVYRSNLAFRVAVAKNLDEKLEKIIPLLRQRTGPAIIYVTLQKDAAEVADHLRPHGFDPMVYHAGMSTEERTAVQNDFMASEKGIVCATIAFGMGIDKANIRQVIHLQMAKTLENYSQEVGRAGRDGLESTCLMFLSAADIPTLEGFCRGDTCSKTSLELWLREVAMKTPGPDGTIDVNQYQQSREYDIRDNVLRLLYAQLELDYGYLRAVTPYYSIYGITPSTNWQSVLCDTSPEAQTIRSYWRTISTRYQLDIATAAENSKTDRGSLARTLTAWEMRDAVTLKASQVRQRFKILKPLPVDGVEFSSIVELIWQRMIKREDEGVAKLKQVVEFATEDECLPQSLATYFGDVDAVPAGMCGKCSFCLSGEGIEFKPPFGDEAYSPLDRNKLLAILNTIPDRDDPRLLARMAFGITSPRLTVNKWGLSHPLFGSMSDTSFRHLIGAFDIECAKEGYAPAIPALDPPKTNKRSYPSSRDTVSTSKSASGTYKSSTSKSTSSQSRGSGSTSGSSSRGYGSNSRGYKRGRYY